MHKTKPKWGSRYITDHEQIDDSLIQQIQEKITFSLDASGIEALKSACGLYRVDYKLFDRKNLIRKSHITAALQALLGNTQGKSDKTIGPLPRLIKMLNELDSVTRNKLVTNTPYADHFSFEILHDQLDALQFAVEDTLQNLGKDKGSGSPDIAKQRFIQELAEIYLSCTGKQAISAIHHNRNPDEYYGPFLDFVAICMSVLKIKSQSINAIGKAIYRYLQ